MEKQEFMRRAIQLSLESVKHGGGPFGAVIVKEGKIIAEAANRVTLDNDPTAHAEVNAIRQAARSFFFNDPATTEIYTSCEPCPMCLGAIYWAHLDHIYYGCNRRDAADAGFDDEFIYQELSLAPAERQKVMEVLLPDESLAAFRMWKEKKDKRRY